MIKSITKFLLLSIALTSISFAGSSQSIDTVCLSVPEVKKVLADAKQKPVLIEKINLLTNDILLLNARINLKDGEIEAYKKKDENNQAIILALEVQKATMQEQRKLFEDQVNGYEKLLRKEKRRHRVTKAFFMASAVIGGYLYLTK